MKEELIKKYVRNLDGLIADIGARILRKSATLDFARAHMCINYIYSAKLADSGFFFRGVHGS